MSTKLTANALGRKNKAELMKQLTELKAELLSLRVQKVTSSSTRLNKISVVRRNIARVLTVINLKQRQALREHYKGKKYLPLDLRPKKTRALRRALTKTERSAKTERQTKKDASFPRRKFAIKAA